MTKNKTPFFFFDIETGGFNPSSSSIYSIAYSGAETSSLTAFPEPGSAMSGWAKKNVWSPIAKQAKLNEQEILSRFLTQLESLDPDTVLTGWNIGYGEKNAPGGFDIPFLLNRAERYEGMSKRFQNVFSRHEIRDIGQEYAFKIAKEVSSYPHLVEQGLIDKDLFEQAKGYYKAGQTYSSPYSPDKKIAKILATGGAKMSGWKQKIVADMLLPNAPFSAHIASEDVKIGKKLTEIMMSGQPIFKTEKDVTRWAKKAAINKKLNTLFFTRKEARPEIYEKVIESIQQIEKFGGEEYTGFFEEFRKGFVNRLEETQTPLSRIKQGLGSLNEETLIRKTLNVSSSLRRFSPFIETARKAVASKYAIFGGIGLLGASIFLDPLQYFTGEEDATTEDILRPEQVTRFDGLQHRGISAKTRKGNTDFGSPYQDQETSSSIVDQMFSASIVGGIGAATTYGIFKSNLINSSRKDDLLYPRLKAMKEAYRKGGLKTFDPNFNVTGSMLDLENYSRAATKFLNPVKNVKELEGFKGLLYYRSAGSNSLETQYELSKIAERNEFYVAGKSNLLSSPEHYTSSSIAYRIVAEDQHLFSGAYTSGKLDRFLDMKDINPLLMEAKMPGSTPETFRAIEIKEKGGDKLLRKMIAYQQDKQEYVVKNIMESVSGGVYFGKLPDKVVNNIMEDPSLFIFQEKLDLVDEFRTISVGDKPVLAVHRWGKETKGIQSFLEKNANPIHKWLQKTHVFENIENISDPDLLKRVSSFTEDVARLMPHEINAYDIGLTRAGDLKLIEVQNIFGTARSPKFISALHSALGATEVFSNPIKRFSVISAGLVAAGLGLALTSGESIPVSANDDDHNTIEGLKHKGMAGALRKQNTDFGSGWRGLVFLDKALEKYSKAAATAVVKRSTTKTTLGTKIKTAIDREYVAGKLSSNEFSVLTSKLDKLEEDVFSSKFTDSVVLNERNILGAANMLGVSKTKYLKSSILHERTHQILRDNSLLEIVTENLSIEDMSFWLTQTNKGRGYATNIFNKLSNKQAQEILDPLDYIDYISQGNQFTSAEKVVDALSRAKKNNNVQSILSNEWLSNLVQARYLGDDHFIKSFGQSRDVRLLAESLLGENKATSGAMWNAKKREAFRSNLSSQMRLFSNNAPERRSARMLQMSESTRRTSMQAWYNSSDGGRRHLRGGS